MRTKQILSANSEAPLSVEELWQDRDFRTTITREKFEELAGGPLEAKLWRRRAHVGLRWTARRHRSQRPCRMMRNSVPPALRWACR